MAEASANFHLASEAKGECATLHYANAI